ncbi:hypothetical protein [Oricola sp.]|uniref:hypothetical protein n=1 Tax=Oricola sp. TaxID=1979950 RepID=UPI0025DE03A5|nr:hypothetical protein [Oricola sp.]MCI5078548.1 hypothetical protein [Oricola sp.]
MYDRFDCQNGNSAAYFARPPERLVLEGYRNWSYGVATADEAAWQRAIDLYSGLLGTRASAAAVQALSEFVGALGRCASCPLKTFETGSRHICRDEVLVMGLIAGIQNQDDEVVGLCLTELSCATRCDEVALAAGSFALVLRGLDKTLLPIPAPVVRDILERSRRAWRDVKPAPTLH